MQKSLLPIALKLKQEILKQDERILEKHKKLHSRANELKAELDDFESKQEISKAIEDGE